MSYGQVVTPALYVHVPEVFLPCEQGADKGIKLQELYSVTGKAGSPLILNPFDAIALITLVSPGLEESTETYHGGIHIKVKVQQQVGAIGNKLRACGVHGREALHNVIMFSLQS